FYDSLKSLSQKIKATLPLESLKYLENLGQSLHIGIKPYKPYAKFREILNRVNHAAVKRKTLEIVYHTMSRKKESRRKVDPYRIWFFNGTFYLIGYCHKRGEIRIFALDRIKLLHETKETFEVPEDFNFEEFMGRSFGVFKGEPVRVRIWFSPEVAGYVKEKIWVNGQEIHKQGDGSIIFEAQVEGIQEVKFWVMSWGANALVLEPELLREEIRAEVEIMLRRYESGALGEEEQIKV
ncbi:MAG: WYL domain-containing protein, partial [Deltaproteobacteria bacterium]